MFCSSGIDYFFLHFTVSGPGSVLEKKLTGGLGLFFGSEIFDILIFLGLEKSLLFFWIWRFFTYFFGVTILIQFIFLGVRLNDLDLQNRLNNNINE